MMILKVLLHMLNNIKWYINVLFGTQKLFSVLFGVTGRFGPIPVRTPCRFGPITFRSGRFGLGRFGPILGVGRFGPILADRFGPL